MFSLHKRSEVLILLMLLLSVSLYGLDYFLFGQVRDIGFGFLGNLAFLPIYVLFVTFMIERILKEREKDVLRQKMKMGSLVREKGFVACLLEPSTPCQTGACTVPPPQNWSTSFPRNLLYF